MLDTRFQRFGFREFWIEDGQFWLNGKRLPLQGGGNWYLQEAKAPHGHRWFGLHMYSSERGMNVNIQRWHRHGDIQIINLHYPGDLKVKDWKKQWGGRPCVNGEFQNYPVLFAMSGPEAAKSAEAVDQMCSHIEHWTSYYKQIQLSGALHFLPYMVGLFTTADRSLMGPWGDLLPDPAKFQAVKEGWMKGSVHISATAPIPWPSLSGPGIKCERLLTGTGNRSLINWFDPQRPSITPNKTYDAFARCWDRMPPLNPERAAEAIVTVTRAGKPFANAAVLARPLDGQCTHAIGVMSDPAGTAWFVFQEPGRYEFSCGESKTVFEAHRLITDSKPGYADVPRVSLAGG